ncbi:ABC transporter substrate-binding protein [Yinghuangia seranimata]|uniref:ABC transporter substrate-binding protein n=1 Tax=Yinghuangia seranimata TaxID=408067 RepID=UPI00248AD4DF|nr:ABC transporter substrate-binding protein [Yinghuangia seranimata]MDI2131601.1 ABC transporter substrate-binding protein [Yinghuangia seranimata]
MVVPLLFVAACSRSGADRIAEGNVGGGGGGNQPAAAPKGMPAGGDFGDLKGLCGPRPADWKPSGNQSRGVTDNEIAVTTMGDPGNQMQPGLGQEFFDMADAFSKWCNDAGGINGRKIKVNKRDGMLMDAASKINEACQSDFMLVGGGNPIDNATVEPRLDCKLGAIPGYVVTTAAVNAPLQVQPGGIPANEGPVGAYKALFEKFPDAKGKVGILGQNFGDLAVVADRYADAIGKAGGTVVAKQLAAPMGQDWRSVVEALKAADVQILVSAGVFAVNATSLVQEMNNAGWAPKAILSDQSAYNNFNIQTAKDVNFPDLYVYTTFWPQEIADQNPAAKLALDLYHTKNKNGRMVYFNYAGLNAWLLWAAAAKDCGADLTVDCVLDKAKRKAWTGGGLFAPNDVGPLNEMHANPCFVLVKLDKDKGFPPDLETTKPNGAPGSIFNCSPDNTVMLDQSYT